MAFKIVLVCLSFVLGVVCIRLISKLDIHEKEPFNQALEEHTAKMKNKFEKEWWFSESVSKQTH